MLLSVIIVNYNVKYYVEQCLRSVFASQGFTSENMEVFVVDNESSDGSITHLRSMFSATEYPGLHLIANRRNVGFGHANNQALRKAKGRYVLYLNPDTMLAENTLKEAVAFAEKQKNLGAIGAKMLNSNGSFALESRRGLPTPWVAFCKMSGLVKIFPKSRRFGKYYMRYLSRDEAAPVDIISGAFMLARRDVLNEMGGFDEDFFMYGEDIDLSYRLLKSGRQNYYIPVPILHYKGESAHRSSFRYVHVFYEAMLIFFNKHFRHYGLVLSLPIKLTILVQALLTLALKNARNFRKFFFPHSDYNTRRYLFVGKANEVMEEIAEQYSMHVDYFDTDEANTPQGHTAPTAPPDAAARYDYIVYDTSAYSRATILRIFASAPGKAGIGTLNKETHTIITSRDALYGA